MSVVKRFGPVLNYLAAPLLFSIYPVIFLYTHNVEILVLNQLIMPLLLAIGLAVVLFLIFLLILKDKTQTSMATVGFLILFWYYGMIFEGITKIVNLNHWHVVPIVLFIYGHLLFVLKILSNKFNFEKLNKIILGTISALLIFNISVIIYAEAHKYKTAEIGNNGNVIYKETGERLMIDNNHQKIEYPDIYLIVLDEYANLNTIMSEFKYDNSQFESFLKNNNFFIAHNSEHRFASTLWNISSLLNLDYIISKSFNREDLVNYFFNRKSIIGTEIYYELNKIGYSHLLERIRNNLLIKYLKKKKYEVIILEGISQHYETFNIALADKIFSYQDVHKPIGFSNLSDEFVSLIINKSMILPIKLFFYYNPTASRNYDATKYVFNFLKSEVFRIKKPKFIYAHIMCPHSPYVYDKDGNYAAHQTNLMDAYLDQYIYATKEIMSVIKAIKNNEAGEAVIIILNDHGPRPHELNIADKTHVFKAFNAVYFADKDYNNLYDEIGPVNTLRVILNKYFNEDFIMIEDR